MEDANTKALSKPAWADGVLYNQIEDANTNREDKSPFSSQRAVQADRGRITGSGRFLGPVSNPTGFSLSWPGPRSYGNQIGLTNRARLLTCSNQIDL